MVARRPPQPHSSVHGLLVTSCGDVALNPGPPPKPPVTSPLPLPSLLQVSQQFGDLTKSLRVTSANVTSLLSQFDVVTHLPGDILAFQETRMGEGAQRHMTRAFSERGWAVAWGKPMPLISLAAGSSPTMWSAHAGGCAVAARCGTPVRAVPPATEAVRRLWEAGRWCHATLPWGCGASFLHVASLYAPVNDAKAADAALFAALTELAALGEVPIILAGDFNLEIFQSPTLSAACTNGGWHDLADLFAKRDGAPAAPTCAVRPGTRPRRIDYMLANTVMLSACMDFSLLDDTGLPTHKPLSVLLSLEAFARRALRPRRPLAFPLMGNASSDPAAAWQPVAQAWTTALAQPGGPDIDAMWVLFSSAAESYFLAKHVDHLDRPPQRYLGRASCKPPRLSPVVAPQARGDQCGALTDRHIRLLKLLRRLQAHYSARLSTSPPRTCYLRS